MDFKAEELAIAFAQAKLIDLLNKDCDVPLEKQIEYFYNTLETFIFETKTKKYI